MEGFFDGWLFGCWLGGEIGRERERGEKRRDFIAFGGEGGESSFMTYGDGDRAFDRK